jgi:hypothetical protein
VHREKGATPGSAPPSAARGELTSWSSSAFFFLQVRLALGDGTYDGSYTNGMR